MQLQDILFSQGFGTRRVCAGLIQHGHVTVAGERVVDAAAEFTPQGLRICVDGAEWEYHEKAYLMLHKPAGTECSRKPSAYPSIYTLLPPALRQRPQKGGVQGVQAVGRLDQDTTGLLLLTDDGQFIHRMSSPRRHVPKVYVATTHEPVSAELLERLRHGVQLHDEPAPLAAQRCAKVSEHELEIVLEQGKYHQVKRMLAAAGNHCSALRRVAIGGLTLDGLGLAPGGWCYLDSEQLALLAPAVQ